MFQHPPGEVRVESHRVESVGWLGRFTHRDGAQLIQTPSDMM